MSRIISAGVVAEPADPIGDVTLGHAEHVHAYQLTEAEAEAAIELSTNCLLRYGAPHDPHFLDDAPFLAHQLPETVRQTVIRARLDDRKHAVLVLGNTVDDVRLGPTPVHWREADTRDSRTHACLLVLYAALLGDVIGWAAQQGGRVITDVLPVPGMEHSLVSACSMRELGWHTEDAFSPHRADHIGLMSLRNPDHTPTTVSYVDVTRLPEDVIRILSEKRFDMAPDDSHEGATDAMAPSYEAVLCGHPDSPVLRIDRDFVHPRPGDTEAEHALGHLIEHIDANLYDIPIRPGDVCFLDNRNVVHGRRPFQPRYDGTDRWLKRVNVVTDLRRTRPGRAHTTKRVIG